MRRLLFIVIIILITWTNISYTQRDLLLSVPCTGSESLRGLENVVIVVFMSLNAQQYNLTKHTIVEIVEEELNKLNIDVIGSFGYDEEAWGCEEIPILQQWLDKLPDNPTLFKKKVKTFLVVSIHVVPHNMSHFMYLIEVEIREAVPLIHIHEALDSDKILKGTWVEASIWHRDKFGLVYETEMENIICNELNILIEVIHHPRYQFTKRAFTRFSGNKWTQKKCDHATYILIIIFYIPGQWRNIRKNRYHNSNSNQ